MIHTSPLQLADDEEGKKFFFPQFQYVHKIDKTVSHCESVIIYIK
jgi:hypothetical protein